MNPRIYKSFTVRLYDTSEIKKLVDKIKMYVKDKTVDIPKEVKIYIERMDLDNVNLDKCFLSGFTSVKRDRKAKDYAYVCELPTRECVRVFFKRPVMIKCARIYKRQDKWYCAVVYSVKAPKINVDYSKSVGIDLGANPYVILSDGTKYELPDAIRHTYAKINRETKRKEVDKGAVRALRNKLRRQFKNFQTQIVKEIFEKYDFVSVEKPILILDKMSAGLYWYSFVRALINKALELGKLVCVVSPNFNSKKCSFCESRVEEIKGTKKVICTKCQVILDRDENAAKNVLQKGLRAENFT